MSTSVILSLTKAVRPSLVDLQIKWPFKPHLEGPLHSVSHGENCLIKAILPKDAKGKMMLRCIDTQSQKKKEFRLNLGEGVRLPLGEELFQLCARSAILEGEKEIIESVSHKYKVMSSEGALLAVERKLKPATLPVRI